MRKRSLVLLALLGIVGRPAHSKDAKSVVEDVSKALGASSVKSIQYSGDEIYSQFGQNPTPYTAYPKFYSKYTRVLDYEKGVSREDRVRTQFENPPHGGGGQPLYREAKGSFATGENSQWGGGALALTPYGWVKAAEAGNPTLKSVSVAGKRGSMISFTVNGKYKVDGYVNSQNLLLKTDTWMPNPILGDTLVETTYADYKDFSGVKVPMKIGQSQGGFPVMDLTVKDVQVNAAVPEIRLPGPPPAVRVQSQKIADGVWYLEGTPDPNSMAVEFKDFMVTIESSVTEGRALANIEEVKKIAPNKPIRYHVNSHHHSDHAAGVRAIVADGTTIITQDSNKKFYENVVMKAPHALQSDVYSQHPMPAKFVYVKDKYVVTDGDRTLEIYYVPGAGHTDNLLMSYLPKEKILFITDIFNQFGEPRPNDPPAGIVSPYYAALAANIKRLNLDVQQIAPSHGKGVVSVDVLKKTLEGTVQAPPIVPPSGN